MMPGQDGPRLVGPRGEYGDGSASSRFVEPRFGDEAARSQGSGRTDGSGRFPDGPGADRFADASARFSDPSPPGYGNGSGRAGFTNGAGQAGYAHGPGQGGYANGAGQDGYANGGQAGYGNGSGQRGYGNGSGERGYANGSGQRGYGNGSGGYLDEPGRADYPGSSASSRFGGGPGSAQYQELPPTGSGYAQSQRDRGGYGGSEIPGAPVPQPEPQPMGVSLAEAVQAAHAEGFSFGEAVARDAPALWLEAVLARKPRMPSDLEARLLQGSALPIDSLLHDEVRHSLRRGFWDALERSRR
jgi:hypothetical protein